jgi:hypothetical protein
VSSDVSSALFFLLSSCSDSNYLCVTSFDAVTQFWDVLFSCYFLIIFFSLCFSLVNFYWRVYWSSLLLNIGQVHWLLICIRSTVKPVKRVLRLYHYIFFTSISMCFFFWFLSLYLSDITYCPHFH